ncbi:ABC-three component system protein [uncultured Chryseobacterium sp.]|uniref:ABC-three component system protein n=1 Tax=uncultured Chryseobacterium sp. TaxID=259322 RepID=UPI0025F2EFE8|nr:ABC-three component system protein [uncultured Chryseobacterium sp.]
MTQEIGNYNNDINQQNNFGNIHGDVRLTPKTRWQKRFEKLQEEVRNDKRYETFIEDFNTYNTIQDGIGLEQKLIDGGFSKREIIRAMGFKEKYAKRVVQGEMFYAQQEIDVEIFSIIDNNFETYVFQKIIVDCDKNTILKCLMENVVQPILDILNREGESDDFLNYTANDIFGMIYFLTGKCHLNWKDYDSLQ